jgi:hypothetical protein
MANVRKCANSWLCAEYEDLGIALDPEERIGGLDWDGLTEEDKEEWQNEPVCDYCSECYGYNAYGRESSAIIEVKENIDCVECHSVGIKGALQPACDHWICLECFKEQDRKSRFEDKPQHAKCKECGADWDDNIKWCARKNLEKNIKKSGINPLDKYKGDLIGKDTVQEKIDYYKKKIIEYEREKKYIEMEVDRLKEVHPSAPPVPLRSGTLASLKVVW